ncbi:MAG: hypothetical protein ABIE74_04560 [Pseudomonadota bacterium]
MFQALVMSGAKKEKQPRPTVGYTFQRDAWDGAVSFVKKIGVTLSQEKKLIEGINNMIRFVDGIKTETEKYQLDKIELNMSMDAEANIVLVTAGSGEGIKVILTRKSK